MKYPERLKKLYEQVTEAIYRAERLSPRDKPAHTIRYLILSALENEIATLLPPDDIEGDIARVGAVRAAITAGHLELASEIADTYLADDRVSEGLRDRIKQLTDVKLPEETRQ